MELEKNIQTQGKEQKTRLKKQRSTGSHLGVSRKKNKIEARLYTKDLVHTHRDTVLGLHSMWVQRSFANVNLEVIVALVLFISYGS